MKYIFFIILALVLFFSGIYHKEIRSHIINFLSEGEDGTNLPTIALKKIQELNTVKAEFSDDVLYKKTGLQGSIPTPGQSYDVLITVTNVKVKAGIDMKNVEILSPEGSVEITIKLPKSEITSVEFSSPTHELLKRHGFGNIAGEPAESEVNRVKKMARNEIIKMAKSAEILKAATANAKEIIREYVKIIDARYKVIFK